MIPLSKHKPAGKVPGDHVRVVCVCVVYLLSSQCLLINHSNVLVGNGYYKYIIIIMQECSLN